MDLLLSLKYNKTLAPAAENEGRRGTVKTVGVGGSRTGCLQSGGPLTLQLQVTRVERRSCQDFAED